MSANHATLPNQALAMCTWRQAVTLIALPFLIAIGLTIYANTSIQTFTLIVWLDVWLFACPHVVATYTRIAYNRSSLQQHVGLLTILPILILLACLSLVSR